ncbi:MAG: carboxypeptidase-like regulatory domain-containing protein [Phaeodactylibacter sp.]|nr:carboxypeptidase-like regulatory domain-containing protein [Phaeodactylibacter sp.]
MKKLSFFIAVLLLLGSCREDTISLTSYGRLAGEVLDAETLAPIAGASVTTNPESELVITDEFGEFTIDSLLEGSYSIRTRFAGYDDAVITVQIEGDRINSVKILITKDTDLNDPPSLPTVLQPANGAQGLDPSLTLSWTAPDPDGDSLTYEVYLYDSDTLVLETITTDTFLTPRPNNMALRFDQRYYWQVVAKDGINPPTYGEVWSFTIREYPRDEFRYVFVRPVNGNLTIFGGKEPNGGANPEEISYQLTNGLQSYWRPRLRPQLRDKMAALRLVGTETHLFIMDRDGTNARQVTSGIPLRSKDESLASYCWSPTGDQLLFMNFGRLYRVNTDGSGLALVAEISDGFIFTGVDWTARNNKIVATAERPDGIQSKLYVFDLDSIPRTRLENLLDGQIRHPVFAPDGRTVAFSYNYVDEFSATGMPLNSGISIYNIETGAYMGLSFGKDDGTNDTQPKFTNGGAKILFVNKPSDNVGPAKVMLMDVDPTQNQNRVLLFENADMPDWN